jgi:prefoldin subunit 5
MKKAILVLATGIFLSGLLHAQDHLFLEEQEINLEDSKSSAWVFPIPRDLDEVLDDLKDFCKERSDLKLKKDGDHMMIAEKVSIPYITALRGDLIGYSFMSEQYYAMALVFQLGYDLSLNSGSWQTEMKNFRNYAKEFMSYHYEHFYNRRIGEKEKELGDVEKDRKQTQGKIDNLTDKINNLGKKIGKEEDSAKITEYENEINTLESDMQGLMDTLPAVDSKINALKSDIETLKTESFTYHSEISSL